MLICSRGGGGRVGSHFLFSVFYGSKMKLCLLNGAIEATGSSTTGRFSKTGIGDSFGTVCSISFSDSSSF